MLPFERLRALETRGGFLRWVQFRNVDVLSRKKKSTVGILRGDSDLQLASICVDVWWSSMVWACSCLYQQPVVDVSSSWDKEVDRAVAESEISLLPSPEHTINVAHHRG